ncbi:hypothetical protein AUJ40_00915 [Candidatus Berkelbacteria bacterium CG1_02_42_45]|uniref:Uncharacterized protein n=1 Tax=Candidatus Berkelbacteria bacterium CG1_02_42_45 TaxID=1805036 RepID=A0A1J4RRE0_9BACT|nr:MAG: hypothetical protein AUJ40_00915 [Candidatus Berkelbacteria bacterium CG1_02_42_45]PIY78391.1 MAG: hypothetical protein COY83_00140 [Parcubacteria group bacterium CG_4_10_14_0_8_um_filter_48_154]
MNMENENAKLVFIYALLGSVESCTDVTHKVPAKVYFNFPIPDLDIGDQKAVLTELKKRKIIANFKPDDGDFIISKPSRSMLRDYYFKLKNKPSPKLEKPVDTKIRFDEKTGIISMGGKPCEIPINTNQYFLCKALFAVPFSTRVKEIDILDLMDWAKDSKDSVYDAMRAVNRKIKLDIGIDKFMKWKVRRIFIDYKTE